MKYFMIDDDEFIDKDGFRHDVSDLDDDEKEEFDDGEKIEIKKSVDFCRRSGDVELSSSFVVVFDDGSIFDEDEGSFTPVRIVESED